MLAALPPDWANTGRGGVRLTVADSGCVEDWSKVRARSKSS
ncbi:MAG TPA: hypothetical protein VNV88_04720 [Candidatus Solibacter sp.]|jgi:hypothetical protein|nr:hypothetical protein [Candidatus Solibacter sp.]